MKILIVTNGYPSSNDLYRNGFVHRRVMDYLKEPNKEFEVFVLEKRLNEIETYTFDNVQVTKGNKSHFVEYVKQSNPSKILFHFIGIPMMEAIEEIDYKKELYIWIHGVEGLAWYRRLFNINPRDFHKYIIINTLQRTRFKKFIKKYNKQIHFIFVSNWMKEIFSKDVFPVKKNYSIIPNIIETGIFNYVKKDIELRKNILLIRPFSSKKYANDIAIDAIKILSTHDEFKNLNFTIVGKGVYFESLTKSIKHFKNVKLINDFLTQEEIAAKHKEHGLFLCPTRQDSQGVSMCEAMSSGLVPMTSNSTAIPEFVEDGKSGFLTNSPKELAEKILLLYNNPVMFEQMSKAASESIVAKCSNEVTIQKELEVINSGLNI